MSWKPTVRTGTDPKFYTNNLAFATQKEAQYSADELAGRWMAVVETGVEESDQPVNYRIGWDSREMIEVPVISAAEMKECVAEEKRDAARDEKAIEALA